MVPVGERTAASEDSAAVAAGAATTEQEDVAEGDKSQGEEKEADVSQVTHVSAWEGVLQESGQIQQPKRGKATAALSPQVQPLQIRPVAWLMFSWDGPRKISHRLSFLLSPYFGLCLPLCLCTPLGL